MKVLVIGPSQNRSKGGMATVIEGISNDENLNRNYEIDFFESFIDGNIIVRLLFSIFAYARFVTSSVEYDVYHIHVASYGSTFRKAKYVRYLKRQNKKVILHIHGASYMVFFASLSSRKKAYVLETLNMCDEVIALSKTWKDRFESELGLTNCVSIPNGIAVDHFADAIVDNSKFNSNFLFLGRLGKRKGAYDLVEAVSLVAETNPNVKLYMAGDGDISQIRNIVAQKGLDKYIEVVGWVDFEMKKELLKKVATVVLPSYNEGLPMTILEGMASKKTIISTRVGAIPEVVLEQNGILVEPGDIIGIANAMKKVISDETFAESCGQNGLDAVTTSYSEDVMHDAIARIYAGII